MKKSSSAFTIVELLIVIVVIAILAAISIAAYNGVQARAAAAKRESDLSTLYKAIMAARINTGLRLNQITGSNFSAGQCIGGGVNPGGVEPKDLAKSHTCWTTYYNRLDTIGQAANMEISGLREGDTRGNPYLIDENEGETACPARDALLTVNPGGVSTSLSRYIPRFDGCS